jgi:hypothetical protein
LLPPTWTWVPPAAALGAVEEAGRAVLPPLEQAAMIGNRIQNTLICDRGRQPGADRHPRWGGDRLHSTPLPQDHNHILAGNTDKPAP